MRIVFAFVLLIGVGLAGSAAYLAMQKFNEYELRIAEQNRNKGPQIDLVEVAVASEALIFGTFLSAEDVRMAPWPKDAVPEGAFTSLESILGPEGGEPRAIIRVLVKDEPILASKVTLFGQDAGVRSRLAPGMRAFTIKVDVTSGVSGFLQPNDKVDIYWTGRGGLGTITKLLLEDVRLIAIDQNANEEISNVSIAKTVTAEVSPQVVAQLTQAQQSGRLTLSLRGAEDGSITGALEVNQDDITGRENNEVVAEKVCTTRTRKGTEVVEVVVDCPDE